METLRDDTYKTESSEVSETEHSQAAPTLSKHFRSLSALFLSAFLLFVAQGLFLTLVPLRLTADGAIATAVSSVASAYFVGVLCGSWLSGQIVESVGHIRAFAGFVAMIISAALLIAIVPEAYGVGLIRFIHGWAAAGTFLTMESWLQASTPNGWRGRVVSAYTFLSLGALGLGQVVISAIGFTGAAPVIVGGVLLALSIVPIALGKVSSPVLGDLDPLPFRKMMSIAPLGVLTGVAAGLNMGAFWALGPVFGRSMDAASGGTMMAIVVFGGALLIWPLGALSDVIGRRRVIALSGLIGIGCCLALLTTTTGKAWLTFALLAVYGGVIFSQYPLALSYATDRAADTGGTVQLTRGLLLCNGLGMALGPILSGAISARVGPSGLFVFAGIVGILVFLVAIWRAFRDPPVPTSEQGTFVPIMETTPAALSMDPRLASDPQLELDLFPAPPPA